MSLNPGRKSQFLKPNTINPATVSANSMTLVISHSDLVILVRVMARSVLMALALLSLPYFYASSEAILSQCITRNCRTDSSSAIERLSTEQIKWWVDYNANHVIPVFHNVISEGLIKRESRALCNGIINWPPGIPEGLNFVFDQQFQTIPFADNWFEFVLWVMQNPGEPVPASEIERVLKNDGILALHLSGNSLFSAIPMVMAVSSFMIVHVRKFEGSGLDHLVAFRKSPICSDIAKAQTVKKHRRCPVSSQKAAALDKLEGLFLEVPSAAWIESRQNWERIQPLPNIMGYPVKTARHVYIDVGANAYETSIGSWFENQYPKQGNKFEIYAIEADWSFQENYSLYHPEVNFLPYYAWIKTGMLLNPQQQNYDYNGASQVMALDLGDWLKRTVERNDYVVMKMDVGGAEYELVPWLVETGAICLIDEIFLECHYDDQSYDKPREVNDLKHKKQYWECSYLYGILRAAGVAAHQWWG